MLVGEGEEKKFEDFNVGDVYVRKVLPARKMHPTSFRHHFLLEEDEFGLMWRGSLN